MSALGFSTMAVALLCPKCGAATPRVHDRICLECLLANRGTVLCEETPVVRRAERDELLDLLRRCGGHPTACCGSMPDDLRESIDELLSRYPKGEEAARGG